MKKLFKVSSYILATVLAFVLSNVSAFAADNNENSSSVPALVVGGVSILLLVVLIPSIKKARREEI